jgi:hypothetical protein
MRDTAQVACVSQDSVRSWRSRPHLSFNKETLGLLDRSISPKDDDIMRNFIDRVDNNLKNHSGVGLKALSFWFGIGYTKKDLCYIDHLDNRLQIVVKPGSEELQLRHWHRTTSRAHFYQVGWRHHFVLFTLVPVDFIPLSQLSV